MEFISTREELRAHYKPASDGSLRKELAALDRHCRNFIEKSPFVLIGSSDGEGNADVTPKGDRPGFVKILDSRTLAIPDRPGNNRLDTHENILVNPAIGLLFLIPGMDETLRVNGEARITFDPALRDQLSAEGKLPQSVIVVSVKATYMHCAKAFMRSLLWNAETWRPRGEMPTLGAILKDQLSLQETASQTDEWLADAYKKGMW